MSDQRTENTMQPLAGAKPALRGPINLRFLALCIVLVLVEIAIAKYVHGGFIRSFVGDVLVVGVVFSLLKTFVQAASVKLAAGALAFCVVIEALQYVHLADWLGLKRGSVLHIALGATFDWLDLLAYAIGFVLILAAIRFQKRRSHEN